jgi:hypothetical protein
MDSFGLLPAVKPGRLYPRASGLRGPVCVCIHLTTSAFVQYHVAIVRVLTTTVFKRRT